MSIEINLQYHRHRHHHQHSALIHHDSICLQNVRLQHARFSRGVVDYTPLFNRFIYSLGQTTQPSPLNSEPPSNVEPLPPQTKWSRPTLIPNTNELPPTPKDAIFRLARVYVLVLYGTAKHMPTPRKQLYALNVVLNGRRRS